MGSPARAGIDPEQPKGMAESSLSARPPPLQYEWSQNMTNLQKMIDLSIRENALIISEIEKRLNTFLGYEGPPELAPPFIGKQPPEVEALLTKRTALLTKQTALLTKQTALLTKQMALLTKQAGLERRRAELERNRTQKQDCAGKIGRPT